MCCSGGGGVGWMMVVVVVVEEVVVVEMENVADGWTGRAKATYNIHLRHGQLMSLAGGAGRNLRQHLFLYSTLANSSN